MHRIWFYLKDGGSGLRGATTVSLSGGISWLFKGENFDQPIDPMVLAEKYKNRDNLTPTERLGLMWRKDEFGDFSPELKEIFGYSMGAVVLGYMVGGVTAGNKSYHEFIRANKQTMFNNPRHAQDVARRQIGFDFTRSGCRLGFKSGVYMGTYLLIAHSMTHAFNRVSPLDHAFAGFVCGSVWNTISGPRSMLATGVIGGTLGFFNGLMYWISHLATGESIGQRWASELEKVQAEQQKRLDDLAEKRAKLDSPLFKMKPSTITDTGAPEDNSVEAKRKFAAEMFRKAAEEEKEEFKDATVADKIARFIRDLIDAESPDPNPDFIPENQPFGKSYENFTIHTWRYKKKPSSAEDPSKT